jgi:hypothetical protein
MSMYGFITVPALDQPQAEALGDVITDWVYPWLKEHPRVRTIGAMFQRDLTVLIDEYSDLDTKQARSLAREICYWTNVWLPSAELGYADMEFGSEWRHSLMRYLALPTEQRAAWHARDKDWKMRNVHFDVGDGVFQQDRPDFPRDVTGVAVRGPAYDSLGNSKVIAFVTCSWEQADDVVSLIKERIPDYFDAHAVICDIAETGADDGIPVYAGITAYLDHRAEEDA